MIHIPISFQKLFLGSLQKHCVRQFVVGGYGSALGTTDLGLPKILVEYD